MWLIYINIDIAFNIGDDVGVDVGVTWLCDDIIVWILIVELWGDIAYIHIVGINCIVLEKGIATVG